MGKTFDDWNKAFFEERMKWLDTQPKTEARLEPSYRQFDEDLVVSNTEPPVVLSISRTNLLAGKWEKGVDISTTFTEPDLYKIMYEAFPLEGEYREVG